MKPFAAAFSFLICAAPLVAMDHFPEQERTAVAQEVSTLMKSFNQGDAKALIAKTHPSIYKLANGRENFEAALLAAAKQIMEQGVTIESFEVGLPKDLYKAGDDSVCFVPKTTLMSVGGQRIRSASYMVAIKGKDGVWRYLDGAGARRNRDQLWTLLPKLPKEVQLPEKIIAAVENEEVQQAGADQPASASESKPKGKEKHKPESEASPR